MFMLWPGLPGGTAASLAALASEESFYPVNPIPPEEQRPTFAQRGYTRAPADADACRKRRRHPSPERGFNIISA